MNQKKQLSIMEFSRLTGIKRENLRFYDRIGLLSPDKRGGNNYRYYSRHQLSGANLIVGLRGLGVGIEDIKKYTEKHTQQDILKLFAQQDSRIEAEMQRLREVRLMMQSYSALVRDMLLHGENETFLEQREQEEIFLCPPIPDGMDEDEGGIFSYDYAESMGINLGFPQGTLISRELLEKKETAAGEQYYFKVSSGGNAYKPAALYAVVYGQCDQWNVRDLYTRLLGFIAAEGLSICGNAYEEYLLGDIETQNKEQFCTKLEIPVVKTHGVGGPVPTKKEAVTK